MRMKCFRAKVYMFQVPCPCTTEPVRHRAYTSSVRAPQPVTPLTGGHCSVRRFQVGASLFVPPAIEPPNGADVIASRMRVCWWHGILQASISSMQLARGIAFMHAQDCAHRDLKPENILIDPSSHVLKIADFGSAKQLKKGAANVTYICSRSEEPCLYRFGRPSAAAQLASSATCRIFEPKPSAWLATTLHRWKILMRARAPSRSAPVQRTLYVLCCIAGVWHVRMMMADTTERPSSFSTGTSTARRSTYGRMAASSQKSAAAHLSLSGPTRSRRCAL
jgi:hypothetical protein